MFMVRWVTWGNSNIVAEMPLLLYDKNQFSEQTILAYIIRISKINKKYCCIDLLNLYRFNSTGISNYLKQVANAFHTRI